MNTSITQSVSWTKLKAHYQNIQSIHLRELFAQDNQRFENFSLESCGLLLDYSKNRLTHETLQLLLQFATDVKLKEWINRLFQGEIINDTEKRAALHIALRNQSNTPILVNGKDVMPGVNSVLGKMHTLVNKIHEGKWLGHTGKAIDTIVNIGIGGSDLGPLMVTQALKNYHHPCLSIFFVSNVDSAQLTQILKEVNPETTLFIIASKTFTTQETMLNANSARAWLINKLGDEQAIAKHFIAISTAAKQVEQFGIDPANMFEFWDWVGGRYSLWSAIGLPIAITIGMDNFNQLLAGAHALDNHFKTAPFEQNMPVLMGLIGVWYVNFFAAKTHTVLPYDFALKYFPDYLQQLVMESLGKQTTRDNQPVDYATCPITWGALGNNGQHAFYQLLHQGTQLVPADFIIAIDSQHALPDHQDAVLSNALAQTLALMVGRNAEETRQAGVDEAILPHRVFPGNQPTNTLVYQKLTPEILGTLIALYEHKTFVQSVCWHINPFDQWGVELGKQVASTLLPELTGQYAGGKYDASTDGLLAYIKKRRSFKK